MFRLLRLSTFAAALISASVVHGQGTNKPATISGYVTSDGERLDGAEIKVRGTSLGTTSVTGGAFSITGIPAGDIVLDVKKLGYVAQEFHVSIQPGEERKVNLPLPKPLQSLPDVTVREVPGKPARLANTHRYDDFYFRRATGIGTFITREEIDKQFKATTQELLQTIPGILIRQTGTTWWVQFTRCGPAKEPGRIISNGASEAVQVFVDGQFAYDGTDRLEHINPAEIEGIEVYKGPSQLPAIARGKGCGAIFVWLRNGS